MQVQPTERQRRRSKPGWNHAGQGQREQITVCEDEGHEGRTEHRGLAEYNGIGANPGQLIGIMVLNFLNAVPGGENQSEEESGQERLRIDRSEERIAQQKVE